MWHCGSFAFDTTVPVIVGILNVTPDSFSDGGAYSDPERAIAHGFELVDQGAHIIDVGGESTRPGATPTAEDVELTRVLPVVEALTSAGICVSIDTRHASVARAAVKAGAQVINDISGFRDAEMVAVAQASDAGLVVVHSQGDPETMQDNPVYTDVVAEVTAFLQQQASYLESQGIAADRICLDPGPGFGKTPQQTLELVRNIHEVVRLGYPVMAALSRKSYLGYAYGIEEPAQRDQVSATESLMAAELGATVIRTHNVAATATALKDLRPFVVLSLGCNVALVANPGEEQAGKIAQLNHAISQLCTLPDSQIVDISHFYASEPAYVEDQDEFVNVIVLMRCGIPPAELLTYLHAIENSLGRVREQQNGPRTCDIDIVDYQMYVVDTDALTLPHPRACERDFVVVPLRELRPRFEFANGVKLESAEPTVGVATQIPGAAW